MNKYLKRRIFDASYIIEKNEMKRKKLYSKIFSRTILLIFLIIFYEGNDNQLLSYSLI